MNGCVHACMCFASVVYYIDDKFLAMCRSDIVVVIIITFTYFRVFNTMHMYSIKKLLYN